MSEFDRAMTWFVGLLLGCFLGGCTVLHFDRTNDEAKRLQFQAVHQGYASYRFNTNTGVVEFTWKEAKP